MRSYRDRSYHKLRTNKAYPGTLRTPCLRVIVSHSCHGDQSVKLNIYPELVQRVHV